MGLPLTPGQQGPEIVDLRRRLARWQREHDLDDLLPPGDRYDEETAVIVKRFQRDRNLPADAEVGPETWKALVEANYALGDRMLWHSRVLMRGDDILDLQQRLNQLGFDAGMEDGIFGPGVREAVEDFQANVGLDVDGVVGARTLEALHRLHRGHHASGVGSRLREELAVRELARRGLIGLHVLIDPGLVRLPDGPQDAQEVVAGVDPTRLPWELATRLSGHLSARGGRPVLSRGHLMHPPTSDRARMANVLAIDLVVSIGLNSSPTPVASGCAAYHYGSLRFVSDAGRSLATHLLDRTLEAGMGPDCRVHPMTWTILRETRMPAVVIEPGFATNPADVRRLADPQVQGHLARSWVDGIAAFLAGYQDD